MKANQVLVVEKRGKLTVYGPFTRQYLPHAVRIIKDNPDPPRRVQTYSLQPLPNQEGSE